MKLELEARLRAFAAFARRGSFSKAAEDLFISQPAVSKHIADLERDLDIQLINRKSNAMGLTEAGNYLAQSVLQAEALLSQALHGLEKYKTAGQAQITLAASGTPGEYLLPPFFALFHLTHPNIHVTFEIGTSNKVVEMVRQHHFEIGIIGGLATATELEVEPLVEDEIILVGHPTLGNRSFTPRDLRNFTWIQREEGSSTRLVVESGWKDLGIIPKSRIAMPSWETVKQAVMNNMGITACSKLVVRTELRTGDLIVLNAPPWKLRRTISLIHMADVPLTPPAIFFREELVNYINTIKADQ